MKARPRLARHVDSKAAWSDERLVRRCLRGDEDAWVALIDKYKRLIYSIPIRYRASPDDAADIFQAVCLDLFEELPRLRKVESLRSWLITVAVRKCLHRKERQTRRREADFESFDEEQMTPGQGSIPDFAEELEREQMLREAIAVTGGAGRGQPRLPWPRRTLGEPGHAELLRQRAKRLQPREPRAARGQPQLAAVREVGGDGGGFRLRPGRLVRGQPADPAAGAARVLSSGRESNERVELRLEKE